MMTGKVEEADECDTALMPDPQVCEQVGSSLPPPHATQSGYRQ